MSDNAQSPYGNGDYTINVTHDKADTLSFVGDEETGLISLYLFNADEGVPVAKVAELSPDALDAVLEQAAGAKHDVERE